ncbi:MAG: shikimate dehydrogenase [Elusimicrobia bacterium]|nr:shikimate dehydrogenase [Elusimicrobiota bacterium]
MKITGITKITGVFGYPVKHSLSPVFHNAAFRYLNLDYVYIPIEVAPENIGNAVKGIKAMNFAGVNITVPYKTTVMPYLDEIDADAKMLCAVNTLVNKEGKIKGYNTDGHGFIRSIKERGITLKDKTIFLLGAGGAACAVADALVKENVGKICICNRTDQKAITLKEHLLKTRNFQGGCVVPFAQKNNEEYWGNVDILINTTSIGMQEYDLPLVEERFIKPLKLVYDIVYNRETDIIKFAQKAGVPFIDGLSMLVYQGAVAFEFWTGITAPVEEMKKAVGLDR